MSPKNRPKQSLLRRGSFFQRGVVELMYNSAAMKSHWIEHKGRRIFFADYSGFGTDSDALRQEVEDAVAVIAAEPEKSVLVLSDLTGTVESTTNMRIIRQVVPRANRAVVKRALLGFSGSRRILLTLFANVLGDTRVAAFDDKETALDWLVKD